MQIDLSKVLEYTKGCLQSRSQMKAVILDMYPGKTREMNVLLSVYESGIPLKIRKEGVITSYQYEQYVQRIAYDYGIHDHLVREALNSWIEVINPQLKYDSTVDLTKNKIKHEKHKKEENEVFTPINCVTQSDEYDLEFVANGVEIKKFKGFEQDEIIVPSKIDDKKVVGIGIDAYRKCKTIKRLVISEGIEYISVGAFAECERLQEVFLPNSLIEIGTNKKGILHSGAFDTTSIVSITCPPNIVSIGKFSFSNCKKLKKVVLPKNLKTLSDSAFSHCSKIEEVVIPSGLEHIGNSVFCDCIELKKIVLPESIKQIGACAFLKCNIEEISLPSSIKCIGKSAFASCEKLKKVRLCEGLEEIEDNAFSNCPSLHTIVIPKSVKTMGKNVFSYKNNIVLYGYAGSVSVEYARNENIHIENADKIKY